jgi:phospholipase A1
LADQNKYDDCLLREIKKASGNVTVDDLKKTCSTNKQGSAMPTAASTIEGDNNKKTVAAVDERLAMERQVEVQPWVLIPHKPNYFLPVSYNSDPYDKPYQSLSGSEEYELDNTEVKFQFSFKLPIAVGLINDRANIFAAYTNTSWWQAYKKNASSPFRETDHEPELFMTFNNDWEFLGFKNRLNAIGISHKSNGRSEPLSRSWNRVYASMIFQRGGLGISITPWYRINVDEENDNNPDITDYLGYGSITAAYKDGRQTFTLMGRKKAIELTWSRRVWGNIRLYGQYFHGYGQSLIEYDKSSDVFGMGFAFSDWL